MTNTAIKPFININGTSRESLLEQNRVVRSSLEDVYDALCQATPHGRDYKNAEEYQKARDEHFADRVVIDYLMKKYEGIMMRIVDA